MTNQLTDIFKASIEALKNDLNEFVKNTTERIDEIAQTIQTLTSQTNNQVTMIDHNTNNVYFDTSTGSPYLACDGSLIFFAGTPRSSASCFFRIGSSLNIAVETNDGASIYIAEVRAVVLSLETLSMEGHSKVHLLIDSAPTIDLVNAILEARDSASLMSVKRQTDLSGELISTLDTLLRQFQLVQVSKVSSHSDRAGLYHHLNSRADFAATSLLRDKYTNQ